MDRDRSFLIWNRDDGFDGFVNRIEAEFVRSIMNHFRAVVEIDVNLTSSVRVVPSVWQRAVLRNSETFTSFHAGLEEDDVQLLEVVLDSERGFFRGLLFEFNVN